MADWANLPHDLLRLIAKPLASIDILRIRSVCASWRSSVPRRASHPYLTISPNDGFSHTSSDKHLRKCTILLISPSNDHPHPQEDDPRSWIVKIRDDDRHPKHFFNPIARNKKWPLPDGFPRELDLMKYRIREVGQEFTLADVCSSSSSSDDGGNLYMEKVVILQSDFNPDSDFVLLTIHISGKLALFKSGDKNWTIISEMPMPYDDVVVYKGTFYGVDNLGRMVRVGLDAKLEEAARPVFGGDKKFLVESDGEVGVVCGCARERGEEENIFFTFSEQNMSEENKNGIVAETGKKETAILEKKRTPGIMSHIWNGMIRIFRYKRDDFEKRLQHISKEEAGVKARMKKRSLRAKKFQRSLIFFSFAIEVLAVVYAIMTTRSRDLNWQMRAFIVLPIFLLPAVSYSVYYGFVTFTKIWDRRDQNTLDRLGAEKKAKIDELKEKTNYYNTQQLIQRYDPDPASKAAAATFLATKLGADSGLNVYVGDESKLSNPTGKSNDVELVHASGLRNRKQVNGRRDGAVNAPTYDSEVEMLPSAQSESHQTLEHNEVVVEHRNPQAYNANDVGWFGRVAALLVGEDPAQSYALICGNCHMHNGLSKKEDFPYITYYCPHCHALNQPRQMEEHNAVSSSPNLSALATRDSVEVINNDSGSPRNANAISNLADGAGTEIEEVIEGVASKESAS